MKELKGVFNQEKARGLPRDCENVYDGSFAALVAFVTSAISTLGEVSWRGNFLSGGSLQSSGLMAVELNQSIYLQPTQYTIFLRNGKSWMDEMGQWNFSIKPVLLCLATTDIIHFTRNAKPLQLWAFLTVLLLSIRSFIQCHYSRSQQSSADWWWDGCEGREHLSRTLYKPSRSFTVSKDLKNRTLVSQYNLPFKIPCLA